MGKKKQADVSKPEKWAEFRLSVIGSLLVSPPEKHALSKRIDELAGTFWVHPINGELKQWSASSIERWFYKAKSDTDTIAALKNKIRGDTGAFRALTEAIKAVLKTQYEAHSSWSIQLHYDNLVCVAKEDDSLRELASYATVRRFMQSEGMLKKGYRRGPNSPGAIKAAKRLAEYEVRSYEVEYINALWHADFHQGSLKVLTPKGEWVTPHLLGVMDDRSRLACHLQWYLTENTENLVHGVSQAFQKRKLCRAILTDCGSAETASEFVQGLLKLSILAENTLPYSAYQNGKMETFWRNIEARLLPMLEGNKKLTLKELNQASQAWVELDYNQKKHHEIKQTPIACYLETQDLGRECPDSNTLRNAFTKKVTRKQRKTDGTISIDGTRFELPATYRKLTHVTLRYTRWNLSSANLIDAQTDQILATIYPVNKAANADGKRKPFADVVPVEYEAPESETPPLLKKLLADYAATGLPQSYIPKDELGDDNE